MRRTIPGSLKWVAHKIAGQRGIDAIDGAWHYIAYTSNPLCQGFYLLLLIGGYLIYVIKGYPLIPNPYMADYHKYLGLANFCVCLWCFVKASILNPGIVTQRNVDDLCQFYPNDDKIFYSDTEPCKTCTTKKPARSKHCALCNVCVCRFDHHCIWVNNCVGIGNARWFLAYLLSNAFFLTYGASAGFVVLPLLRKNGPF